MQKFNVTFMYKGKEVCIPLESRRTLLAISESIEKTRKYKGATAKKVNIIS